MQDPTNHPAWTGKEVVEIKEESRAASYMSRLRGRFSRGSRSTRADDTSAGSSAAGDAQQQ